MFPRRSHFRFSASCCLMLGFGAGVVQSACSSHGHSSPASSIGAGVGGDGTSVAGGANGGVEAFSSGGLSNGGTSMAGTETEGAASSAARGGGVNGVALGGAAGSSGGSAVPGGSTQTGTSSSGVQSSGGVQPSGGSSGFVLAWQDDFDVLDKGLWQEQSFSWDGNLATFTPGNATVQNGIVTLSLTPASNNSSKPYLGVELRSTKTLSYGRVSARVRFAKGSGVVSGLVLFYTPYPNCDWNEIDIEHLGKTSASSQLNAMVYLGSPQANCSASVTPTQDPLVTALGFDAESDFHVYDVEWTPAGVKYFADGNLLRSWTQNAALLRLPMNILLTIWASNAVSWAGAVDTNSAPTSAQLDWIKVYDWKP